MKVALIQMNSVSDKPANLARATTLAARAAEERPDLILLPETFDWAGGSVADKLRAAEPARGGPAYEALRAMARAHRAWVHGGSFLESAGDGRVRNLTVVFDRDGREVARYAKLHLFDVVTPDGMVYRESDAVVPGREVVTYDLEGITVGCAICYDLRFPELFQALAAAGARIMTLPAAFTLQTGKDHWEVLLRARAIETGAYVLAPAQCGSFLAPGGPRQTYGHSLVADPWGHVVARASDGEGVVAARLDLALVDRVRAQLPVLDHKVLPLASPGALRAA